MRDFSEIGIRHFGSRPELPPPTLDQIAFLEGLIDARLPASYVKFLMFSNGGYPTASVFFDKTESSCVEWEVDHFFHVGYDLDSTDNIVWQYRHRWSGATKKILPIADDGMGNLICLDLNEPQKSRVIVWVHDDPTLPVVEAADSFEEFIESLTLPCENH